MYSRENPSQDYKELVTEYQMLHTKGNDIVSGEEIFNGISLFYYLNEVEMIINKERCISILDYGCGKALLYSKDMFNKLNFNPLQPFGALLQMRLAPTTGVGMAGGLQDTDADHATLQEFIPEVWGASIKDYMEKNLVFGALCNDQSAMVANGGDRIHLPAHTELSAADTYGGGTVMVEKIVV